MKKLYLVILISSVLNCGSNRKTVYNSEDFKKEEIIYNLEGTKTELYIKSNDWMVKNFVDSESVILFSDKESGTILGKYLIQGTIAYSAYGNTDTRIFAHIDIKTKDNSAKIIIEPTSNINIYRDSAIEEINTKLQKLVTDFKLFMNKKSDNDW